ncbi:unnamed protein product [Laminaria digitata]
MDADITLESQPGQGSTFTLVIRAASIDTPHQHNAPEQNTTAHATDTPASVLDACRILAVDDAKDNRMLLHHYFKRTGADIEFAHDGQQAVDMVNKAIASNQPFDIILMDMQMPILDG